METAINTKSDRFRQDVSDTDRTIDSVRNSASNLLSVFRSKLDELKGDDTITRLFIRQGIDGTMCFEEAIKFFGTDIVPYIAIDGTQVEETRLDMIVFYAGAFGYRGEIRFDEEGKIVAGDPQVDQSFPSISCAVPISEEYASEVAGEKTGWGTDVDTSRISQALMRLSEYLLTFDSIVADSGPRVVLMDRTISGDIAHISWKMREHIADPDKKCFLEGYQTSFGKITRTDLELGRMLISNKSLKIPAPRSQFLKYAVMELLSERNNLTLSEICSELGISPDRSEDIITKIQKKFPEIAYDSQSHTLTSTGIIANHLDRLLEATLNISGQIFGKGKPRFTELGHPLKIVDPTSYRTRWLNCNDIDYLTLVLISAILRECWEHNILLLGIAKDSAANELSKAVIPLLKQAGLLQSEINNPAFDSDKMLLQANSLVNSNILSCPWRTFEYDVCFRTVAADSAAKNSNVPGTCNARGAFKNVIAGERMFVKAYFQLWNSASDPNVRSHVFLYDRPCYPQYDICSDTESPELVLNNLDNKINEKIVPAIHFVKDCSLSELVLGILYSMGTEAIPEALGHNYPLFLADKRAKVAENQAHTTCVSAVELELNKARLDQQILFQGAFRGYRSNIESDRRKKKKTPPR